MAGFIFDLKHAMYAAAGAAIGGIAGYLFGVTLYILLIASSAFASSNTVVTTFVSSASVIPLIFAASIAAIGFFGGYYLSNKSDETPKPQ